MSLHYYTRVNSTRKPMKPLVLLAGTSVYDSSNIVLCIIVNISSHHSRILVDTKSPTVTPDLQISIYIRKPVFLYIISIIYYMYVCILVFYRFFSTIICDIYTMQCYYVQVFFIDLVRIESL